MTQHDIYRRPSELLQRLIRFDTTNPPGSEAACVAYIDDLLRSAGISTTLLETVPGRPNLIARLPGAGTAPPLMLYGHVDVVTTEGQNWALPPFGGDIHNGYLWGRGTLDMKGGVAMMLAACLRAHHEATPLPGDVVLCILSDEEAGGNAGARYLVDEHPGLFSNIRYAIGEFGGFSMYMGGRRFYPIQVTEKGICWLKLTVHGPAGHGSMPMPGGTVVKLAAILHQLGTQRLPVHITPPVRLMFDAMAASLDGPARDLIASLLDPAQADHVLDEMGESGRMFNALLHNTASPTVLQASSKINVIPGTASVEVDCRLLPGQTDADALREIRALIGDEAEIEIVRTDLSPPIMDMSLFDTLADVLRQADPDGTPIPWVMFGGTDGRFFARLGIQTYGFLPMLLPPEFPFFQAIHAADERIPLEAMDFGAQAMFWLLQRFH
jgi:acetylornithine deacetylase/succinyl-diaminopimelate desuccinylase-like protein